MNEARDWRGPLRRLRRYDVSLQLASAMLLLALLPVLILSVYNYNTLNRSLTGAEERALLGRANDASNALASLLRKNQTLVEYVAKSEAIVRYAAADSISERARYQSAADAQLRVLSQQDPSYEAAGVIDLDGVFIIDQVRAAGPSRIGGNVTASDYFATARAGQPAISNIEVTAGTNQPAMVFAAPILDGERVVGVVALRAGVEPVQRLLTGQATGGLETLIVDDRGIVLLHGSRNERFQYRSVVPLSDAQQEAYRNAMRFGPNLARIEPLGAPGFDEAFRRGGENTPFTYTLDGEPYRAAMKTVAGVPWRVVTATAERAFTGPIAEGTRRNLLVGLIVAVVAVVVAAAMARRVTNPLNRLEEVASRITAGDYAVRVAPQGDGQFARVGRAIDGMVDQVTSAARQREQETEALQRQIVRLLDEVSAVAEGDLTVEAEVTADALGTVADSFNYMIAELRRIIGRVNAATRQVAASTEEILATTDVLARSAEQQAGRIADTSTAMEEMAVSIQQVSENATLSANVAREARATAEAGTRAVSATVAGMGRIRGQVQETAKTIKRLGESSQEIGQAVQLIEEIARRTNRLALNAAIQAAMAGEHGKGFAIVAEEVRRLAERTSAATGQIEELVGAIQAETAQAVVAMEEGTREVVSGSRLADEAGQSLQQIDAVVGQLAELIEAISLAAEQQARASAGIARAMGEISAVTQGATAGAQQAAQSVSALATLADDLRASVAAFRLGDAGPGGAPPVADGRDNGHGARRAEPGGRLVAAGQGYPN